MILDLPDDIWGHILSYLSYDDILSLTSIEPQFQRIAVMSRNIRMKMGIVLHRLGNPYTDESDRTSIEVNFLIGSVMNGLLLKFRNVYKLLLRCENPNNTSDNTHNNALSRNQELVLVELQCINNNISLFENLRILSIDFSNIQNLQPIAVQALLKFICCLKNLKDLGIRLHTYHDLSIVERDCERTVSFNLVSLMLSLQTMDKRIVMRILPSQAKTLEELALKYISDEGLIKMVFQLCKYLKRLTIDKCAQARIFSESFSPLKMENLQSLKDQTHLTNPAKVFERFPNINTLICNMLTSNKAASKRLLVLKIKEICFYYLRDFDCPNLVVLSALTIARIDAYWDLFALKNRNLKYLTFGMVVCPGDLKFIINSLRMLTKLKSFKYYGKRASAWQELDTDEAILNCCEIKPNIESRTVMVSRNFSQKEEYSEAYVALRETYAGYKFLDL